MNDGGYSRPEHWLSDGWATVTVQEWKAPLYWSPTDAGWEMMTLHGVRAIDPDEPVCHVSYYEADAYARWCRARLPTEAEWELAATGQKVCGRFVEDGHLHPGIASSGTQIAQLFGDLWEWTQSPDAPYPNSRTEAGALGEYNAKFMCNQFVLRGGSCATPMSHIRSTYRNFFPQRPDGSSQEFDWRKTSDRNSDCLP